MHVKYNHQHCRLVSDANSPRPPDSPQVVRRYLPQSLRWYPRGNVRLEWLALSSQSQYQFSPNRHFSLVRVETCWCHYYLHAIDATIISLDNKVLFTSYVYTSALNLFHIGFIVVGIDNLAYLIWLYLFGVSGCLLPYLGSLQ
jgi:hypothetical protein